MGCFSVRLRIREFAVLAAGKRRRLEPSTSRSNGESDSDRPYAFDARRKVAFMSALKDALGEAEIVCDEPPDEQAPTRDAA
jgi:hypothetical protein